jgi:hypothetical protein
LTAWNELLLEGIFLMRSEVSVAYAPLEVIDAEQINMAHINSDPFTTMGQVLLLAQFHSNFE